ncbi:glycosyltransferase family 4 protein [Cloacibacillus porcorum]|uniref:Glycosyltransferase subfamily 4-like N-terminal domain-containing protein n=1 Tax=Cloacibacillus porcorum TaxID=1197717 RepID=A0A1B2I7C0_9BACT|nr:glycosyltransferase family 4 protein [Cloacibacillus porcorum]ANZ45853.1 hypothetical protein BED41_12620 [Cloacibacillus porcorum]
MKIIEILPELDIGGVERHVIDLSNELAERGHEILVISAGGKMQCQLSQKVSHIEMPVHKKNPLTGWFCARKIARLVENGRYQLIHAHSRVPAWIARWASNMSGIPYVVTAHVDFGNKSRWIYSPYRDAARVICVSEAVREGMKQCFYENTQVVLNGLNIPGVSWRKDNLKGTIRFLFVGRLSLVKGLQDILKTIRKDGDWTLDILGDGPMKEKLEDICKERGFENKITFHGYSDMVDQFMANSSCLLFPSYTEGMPLTLARAVQIGIPVIASNIPSVREMAGCEDNLIPPGDLLAWEKALVDFMNVRKVKLSIPLSSVPTLQQMVDQDERIYEEVIELCERERQK